MKFKKKFLKAGIVVLCLFLTGILCTQALKDSKRNGTVDEASASVLAEKTLIVGGHSVGVRMDVKGVLVVGLEEIEDDAGSFINPGLLAGLEVGDIILEVNGVKVYRAAEVQHEVNRIQGSVELKILRKNDKLNISITPVYSASDKVYKLGVWVKDKTAGIGTLTFYDPETGCFGALGHGITDPETGTVFDVAEGELLNSRVQSVKEGKAGNPGEIHGIFYEAEAPLGQLCSNTVYGIFGNTYSDIKNPIYPEPMVVGSRNTVETGPAYILTTLNGNEIEQYEILIESLDHQDEAKTRSMTICVTDERLLEKCGGIVQGMSGSPIIQNGRIVGAVTHVFVNNPKKGYGIFIDWMLEECEKIL